MKLNSQRASTSDYLESIEGIFDIFCPNEDMADFRDLQGKLEPLTFIADFFQFSKT